MPINCTDCRGELDPTYFDTRCRDCEHDYDCHTIDGVGDGVCSTWMDYAKGLTCGCGEWRQKVLRCETCEARARNQDSYDNLTPWQQWSR